MAPSGDGSAATMRPNRQSRRNAKKRAARNARAAAADESDVAFSDGADAGAPESSADEAPGTITQGGAHARGKVHVRGAGGAHGKVNPFLPPQSDASDAAPSESEASESDASLSRADAQSARKRKAEKHQARRRTAATKKKKATSNEATLSQVLDQQQQQQKKKKKPKNGGPRGGRGGGKKAKDGEEKDEGDCCCYCMIVFLGLCVVLTVGLRIAGEQWRPDEDEWNEHYTVLGLEPGATQREIKRAFRQLSVRKHPDKSPVCKRDPDSAACTRVREEFMRMTQAHDALYEGKRRNNAATWYNQEDKASYMPE